MSWLHNMYSGSKDFHIFDDRAVALVQKQPDIQALGLRQGDDLHNGGCEPRSVDQIHAIDAKVLYHNKIQVIKVKDRSFMYWCIDRSGHGISMHQGNAN